MNRFILFTHKNNLHFLQKFCRLRLMIIALKRYISHKAYFSLISSFLPVFPVINSDTMTKCNYQRLIIFQLQTLHNDKTLNKAVDDLTECNIVKTIKFSDKHLQDTI